MPTLKLEYKSGEFSLNNKKKNRLLEFVNETNQNNSRYLINGFSDSTDDHEYNLALSKARTIDVENQLKTLGVTSNRIQTRSFGERYYSGNVPLGQINRSVTITVE